MEIIGNRELTYLYAAGTPFAIHEKNGEDVNLYYLHIDYQGSIRAITNQQGIVVETRDYDACSMGFRFLQATSAVKILAPSIPKERSEIREGRPRNPVTLEYTATNPFSVTTITNRGYTFHVRETWFLHKNHSRTIPLSGKHIFEFSLINMNARMYDPVTRRVISPDNYIQAPDNTQSFNRYSYCWNNPLKYTDPDGNVVIAAVVIGAVVGAYVGGRIANEGIANPLEWNYDAQTWGYMAAGAVVGGASGGMASKIAVSGAAGAKTGAIAYGSYSNSVGTHIYTGGQTSVSISYGFGNYNFGSGKFDGIWNWSENSTMENIGYSLGAFGNISDAWALGTGAYGDAVDDIKLHSDNHSRLIDKSGNVLLDVGINAYKPDINKMDALWGGKIKISTNYRQLQKQLHPEGLDMEPTVFNREQLISGARLDKILQYKTSLNEIGKTYGFFSFISGKSTNCTAAASIALLKGGVFNIPIGVPGFLSLQMYTREYVYFSHYIK